MRATARSAGRSLGLLGRSLKVACEDTLTSPALRSPWGKPARSSLIVIPQLLRAEESLASDAIGAERRARKARDLPACERVPVAALRPRVSRIGDLDLEGGWGSVRRRPLAYQETVGVPASDSEWADGLGACKRGAACSPIPTRLTVRDLERATARSQKLLEEILEPVADFPCEAVHSRTG